MSFSWPIIGHKKIVHFLQKSIESGQVAHAYLFYGPENLGKKSIAKLFAMSLICEESGTKPCGKCSACLSFLKDIHPDVIWLRKEEDKKNISIDQIRNLKEKICLSRFTSGYKVVIIVNVEEINKEAANSFLKILEEPPLKSVIILLANKLKNIPETILSRCQIIKFLPVAKKEISDFLKKEHKFNQSKIEELSSLALGLPGRVRKFLEDTEFLEEYLNQQELLIKIIEVGLSQRLKLSKEISASDSFNQIISHWKILVRDLILYKTNNENLIVNFSLKNKIKKIAEKFTIEKIYYLALELNNFSLYFNQNVNLRLALDNFVINL